jgi:hypothetical protein
MSILAVTAAVALWARVSPADIYSWTDANGVKHFSNAAPPDSAVGVTSSEEESHDAQADQQRVAIERQADEQQWQKNQAEIDARNQPPPLVVAEPPPVEPPAEVKPDKSAAKRERLIQAGKKLRGEGATPKN